MTNEQKANEICCKDCTVGSVCEQKGHCEMYKSVLRTADWKDKEFKKEKQRWIELLEPIFKDLAGYNCGGDLINDFIKLMDEQ